MVYAYTLIPFPQDLELQQHRLDGEEYISVIDEFMEAVFTRWPHIIVQFEDFQRKWAFNLLQRSLYVTGTSVIGIKYKDGILMTADMGGSYRSTLSYKSVERMKSIGKHSHLGASGEVSDFQEILRYLDELMSNYGQGTYLWSQTWAPWLPCSRVW
ncbi:Nad-dependent malic enzyme 1 protein [Thalictrum thalictroides]|uniref:Nad-dependent malic enzyme 1 protein n=1 Tax=Thalictrum thalictroides TaxID=46969 RepID=A0A7J6UZI6_THATH|nr:Nad-dependent malic enzyme 1 protein [Thalictrum thalictroides]